MVMLRPPVMASYKPITTSQLGEGKVTRMISERIVKRRSVLGPVTDFWPSSSMRKYTQHHAHPQTYCMYLDRGSYAIDAVYDGP